MRAWFFLLLGAALFLPTLAHADYQLAFGTVPVGQSKALPFNTAVFGTGPGMFVDDFHIVGPDSKDFQLINCHYIGGPYRIGTMLTTIVRFTPSRIGAENAQIYETGHGVAGTSVNIIPKRFSGVGIDATSTYLNINDAQMVGPSTMRMYLAGDFHGASLPVHVQSQINGSTIDFLSPSMIIAPSTSGDGAYIDIDFSAYGVARFKTNTAFTLTASVSSSDHTATSSYDTTIPLPVVLIPGIDPSSLSGNNPGFGTLIDDMKKMSSSKTSHTVPFTPVTASIGRQFANLFAFVYERNQTPFDEAATALSQRWATSWKSLCYADRFNIVAHSQGTLIARSFLSNPSLEGYNDVRTAILAQGPHLGSGAALAGKLWFPNYEQLYPLWPWFKAPDGGITIPSTYYNEILTSLNNRTLNTATSYVVCYSEIPMGTILDARCVGVPSSPGTAIQAFLSATVRAGTAGAKPLPVVFLNKTGSQNVTCDLTSGDLIVPTFSQRGRFPNNSFIKPFQDLVNQGKLREISLGNDVQHTRIEQSPVFVNTVKRLCLD